MTAATPLLAREHSCAAWVRFHAESVAGPRGGKRTAMVAICAQCGHRSKPVPSVHETTAGRTAAGRTARTILRMRECPNPWRERDADRCLRALTAAVRDRRPLPLAFAVEFQPNGEHIVGVLSWAWGESRDGFAMSEVLYETARRTTNRTATWCTMDDAGRVSVSLDAGGDVHVSAHGPRAAVARVLRRLVTSREVLARLAACGVVPAGGAT